MTQDYLTIAQIAELTGLSKSTVRNAVYARDLAAVRVKGYKGRRGNVRIPHSAYVAWQNACFEKI